MKMLKISCAMRTICKKSMVVGLDFVSMNALKIKQFNLNYLHSEKIRKYQTLTVNLLI